jgi:hypothetical protein
VKISATRQQVGIDATAEELTMLHRALGSGQVGPASFDTADPDPSNSPLGAIEIDRSPGLRLRVWVDWERRVLRIVGGDSETQSFAANVLDLALETPVGSQHRFDYFRDHFYLDPDSIPLVIRVTSAA